jgi:hypothetical protein
MSRSPIRSRARCLALAALTALPLWSSAAVVETDVNSGSGGLQSFYDNLIVNSDLINAGRPTLASVVTTATPSFALAGLNDGVATVGNNNTLTYWSAPPAGGVDVTFTLNTSTNTAGYDITKIAKFNGWGDSTSRYGNQVFSVSYSKVATPATFVLIKDVSYTPYATNNAASGSSVVTLTDDTGTIASGVAALRFHFVPVPGTTAEIGVFREIDVTGTPTAVPEPTTLAAAGLLAAAALTRRRRLPTR